MPFESIIPNTLLVAFAVNELESKNGLVGVLKLLSLAALCKVLSPEITITLTGLPPQI